MEAPLVRMGVGKKNVRFSLSELLVAIRVSRWKVSTRLPPYLLGGNSRPSFLEVLTRCFWS